MKDIKELAPELAHRTCNRYKHGDEWPYQFTEQGVIDYATRLIAAYHAEQEPVSLYPCGFKELNSLVIKNGAYLARGMYEGEPVTESIRSAAMVLIGYAKDMSILLAKQPLYAAPPEPAQNLYREIYEVWAGSEGIPMPRTAPEAYLLGLLEQMVDIAKTGMHMTEPAPQTDGSTTVSAPDQERMSRSACAAPSSEEVTKMVARLYGDLDGGPSSWLKQEAAAFIERLAARVDDLKQANDGLATAGILPDGCVVVPREPTDEMRSSYMNANREYWFEYDKLEAPIGKWCAGTVKQAFEVSYKSMIAAYKGPSNE